MIKQVIVVLLSIMCPALIGFIFDDSTSGYGLIKTDIDEPILDDDSILVIDDYSVTFEKNNKILGFIDNWSSKTFDVQLQAILYPDR